MKKKTIEVEIDHKINEYNGQYGFNMPIDELINRLQEAKAKGAETISVEPSVEYDCPYIYISFCKKRLETDEEYQTRISDEAKKIEEQKQRELATLERLKLKYKL